MPSIGDAAGQVVREPLIGERITSAEPVRIDMGGFNEEWSLVVTTGKKPPYGYVDAGRILILTEPRLEHADPLAGLLWIKEHGRKMVTHVWVDPEVQRRRVGHLLIDAYKRHVSAKVTMAGPFSDAGRWFAQRIGAKIVEEEQSSQYREWYEQSSEELTDYVTDNAGLGGLSDAHTRLNLLPEMFEWRFEELPVSELLRIQPKSAWRNWYENERAIRRDEDGDDNYFDGLEQEWSSGFVGPIVVVHIDGELDIGDGWHRSAIAVIQNWKVVPAVVGELKMLREPRVLRATCRSVLARRPRRR